MIHYNVDQTYWECHGMLVGEVGLRAPPLIPRIELFKSSGWDDKSGQMWQHLVGDYSKRNLTRGSDKLVALSGLVSRIAMLTDDQYYAGVWKSRMWQDLLWRVYLVDEWEAVRYHYKEDWDDIRDTLPSAEIRAI
jgi:hypothetical protein